MNNQHVWIIDDDESIRWVLEKAFEQADIRTTCFSGALHVMERLAFSQPDVIISDIRMPGLDGLTLLKQIREAYPHMPVVITTAHSDLDSAVSAYHDGAFDYLPKPFDVEDAVAMARRAIAHHNEQRKVRTVTRHQEFPEIIGEARAMQEVFRAIGRLSRSQETVLILGESGTGKELVAHALHKHSPRYDGPFVAINMAAIPKDLIESELFGHEKGAFTGATEKRIGRFEQAQGGTLFLDEIGDMPADCQTRLLRVLAEGEFYRVGGETPIRSDVRVITATHQCLEDLVARGAFREDLYHRLNVIQVKLPTLVERREDIPKLAQYFLHKVARELNNEPKRLLPETIVVLQKQSWPGNVRQLENLCRWLSVMASGRDIHPTDLPADYLNQTTKTSAFVDWETPLKQWADEYLANFNCEQQRRLLDEAIPTIERIFIETALEHTRGRRRDAAELLGWGRNTLTRKIKDLQL